MMNDFASSSLSLGTVDRANPRSPFGLRRRGAVLALGVVLGIALGAPPRASAQSQAAAEALFRSAQDAAEKGDWRTACDRFEESQRLEPAPGTVLNLARCREKLGEWASAWNRYSEAAQKLPASDPRASLAKRKMEELAPKVPHVTLEAPSGPEEFEVKLGELVVARAMFGVPLPVDPGRVLVVVTASGREPWSANVELAEGESRSIPLELGPPRASGGTPESGAVGAPRDSGAAGGTAWPWVTMGAGAALLGAGIGFQIWAGNENAIVVDPDNCEGRDCNRIGYDASQRGQLAQTLGIAAFVGGAALGGLGVFLLVGEAGEPSSKSVSLGVRPTAGGALLSVGGSL